MSAHDRLGWYAKRLTLMQPAEVASHVQRAGGAYVDAAVWKVSPRAWARRWEPADTRVFGNVREAQAPLGFLTPQSAMLLARVLPAAADEIVAEATRRLAGDVKLLGYEPFRVSPDWDGATDPFSGERWPDRHGRLIDFRHGVPGDPKLIWELHRLQELPLLVLAAQLAGEEAYAAAALNRMLAWLSRHPPGRGIPWANTFEPGLRALSLAVAFDGLRGSSVLEERSARSILRGLWQHGRWIEAGLSRHSSANNHLVGELLGLLAVGLLAPELAASRRWASLAAAKLGEQADAQVLADGAGAEQSFAYSVFVLDLLLVAAALIRTRDLEVGAPIGNALHRAGDALALLLDRDEPDPAFGDADDGRALVLDGSRGRHGRGIAAGIVACCGHGGARRIAATPDAMALLLFGEEGIRRSTATPPAAPAGSGALEEAGVVVLRTGGVRVLFDVGRLGYLSIAAHGHADALSVALSDGCDEVVVDPGTGSYSDPARRRWFRGTAAHATVTVDDRDQSEQGGAFLWLRHGNARLLLWDPDRLVAVGEHDGYHQLPDPVEHRRALVRIGERAILVVDRLEGRLSHSAVQNWPLHPACTVRELATGVVEAMCGDDRAVRIALASTHPATTSIDQDGSWSRSLESWQEAPRCRLTASFTGVVHLAAVVGVGAPGDAVPVLRLEDCAGHVIAHVAAEGHERTVRMALAGEPEVDLGT